MLDNTSLRTGIDEQGRLWQKSEGYVKNAASSYDKVWKTATTAVAGYLSVQGVSQFVSKMVQVRGEFQQLEIAFGTMLKSGEKAKALMSDLSEFAATTPFGLQSSASAAKQLLAYGSSVETLIDEMRMLGDVAAGTSQPIGDLVYLYGTLRTQGRAYMMDIRQFAGRGIPIYDELAKVLGTTKDKVNEFVSAGKVGFAEVEQAFKNMTSSGGMYGGLMEAQSKSVTGRIEQLKDAIDIMFNEIGKSSEGVIYSAISGAASLVENYEKVGKVLVGLVATYGAYRAALIFTTVATKGWTAAELIHYNVLVIVEKAQKLLNKTMLANPYVLVATLAVGLVATMWALRDSTTAAEKAQKEHNDRLSEAKTKYDELITVVRDETKAITDRQAALEELRKIYPALFKDMDIEAVKLANLTNLTKQATLADLDRRREIAVQKMTALNEDAGRQRVIKQSGSILERGAARRRLKEIEDEKKIQRDIIIAYYDRLKAEDELSKKAAAEAEKAPRNKTFWEAQKKSAEDALATMDAAQKGGEEWNKLVAELNEANSKLQTWNFGGDAKSSVKATSDAEKAARERAELQRKLEDEVAQAEIDAMEDGLAKILAQNERNFQIEKRRIEEQYKELDQASRDFLIGEARIQTDASNKAARDAVLQDMMTFLQKYQKIIADTNTKIKDAQIAGASLDMFGELSDQENDTINRLAEEYAAKSADYEAFMRSMVDASVDEIHAQIDNANSIIEQIVEGGIDNGEIEKYLQYIARLNALKDQLNKDKPDTSPDKDSEKDWKKLYSTLQKVEKEFNEIGDAVGGMSGEIIKTAGTIATSTLNIIDGIVSFSKISAQTIEGVSISAANAIKSIEKASVILAIIGAILKVIQIASSLFKDNEEQIRKSEEAARSYAQALKEIEISQKYDLFDTVFGENSIGKFNAATEIVKEALKDIQDQRDAMFAKTQQGLTDGLNSFLGIYSEKDIKKRLDEIDGIEAVFDGRTWFNRNWGIWGTGKHKIKTYVFDINEFINSDGSLKLEKLQAWYDAYSKWLDDAEKQALEDLIASGETYLQAMEAQTAYIEQLWGDVKSSIADTFADSYLEGEDFFEGLTDLAKNYAKELAKSMINKELSEKVFTSDLEDKLMGLLRSGDTVGANNLISGAIKSAGELAPLFEGIMESVGLIAGIADSSAGDARTSASQGFAQTSQDSFDVGLGIWTNMDNTLFDIRGMMRDNQQRQQANTDAMLGHLSAIHANTDRLEAVENHLAGVNRRLDDVVDGVNSFVRG
jgi:tape measure domain-containing protein